MKKTIVLIVTLIALTIASYSQVGSVFARYSMYGTKNAQDSFVFEDRHPAGITFTMRGDSITATDLANSIYKIKCKNDIQKEEDKEYQLYTCTDELGRECTFMILVYYTGEKFIALCYDTWSIIYQI